MEEKERQNAKLKAEKEQLQEKVKEFESKEEMASMSLDETSKQIRDKENAISKLDAELVKGKNEKKQAER